MPRHHFNTAFPCKLAPQLVLMAFLQRIVNGGGYVDREYGIGRGRIDLLVRWPYTDTAGKRVWQREALELKTWADKKADPLAQGLKQLESYLDRLGLQEGGLAPPRVACACALLPMLREGLRRTSQTVACGGMPLRQERAA
jgi:hypothetical protein